MAVKSEFVSYILELMESFEEVSAKRMFGGYGIFKEGLMFALATNDILYFKTDDYNRFEFERLNLGPFVYTKKNKPVPTSYYQAPDEVFDSSDEMLRWAHLGFDAAFRKKMK
jgi:DNA transformation protein and related proteins